MVVEISYGKHRQRADIYDSRFHIADREKRMEWDWVIRKIVEDLQRAVSCDADG